MSMDAELSFQCRPCTLCCLYVIERCTLFDRNNKWIHIKGQGVTTEGRWTGWWWWKEQMNGDRTKGTRWRLEKRERKVVKSFGLIVRVVSVVVIFRGS